MHHAVEFIKGRADSKTIKIVQFVSTTGVLQDCRSLQAFGTFCAITGRWLLGSIIVLEAEDKGNDFTIQNKMQVKCANPKRCA